MVTSSSDSFKPEPIREITGTDLVVSFRLIVEMEKETHKAANGLSLDKCPVNLAF